MSKKTEIKPDMSATGFFGVVLIVVSQIIAIVYAANYYKMEVAKAGYAYLTETVVNEFALWVAASISVSGIVTGLLLVSLAKCAQELACIRQLLNEEAGRVTHS